VRGPFHVLAQAALPSLAVIAAPGQSGTIVAYRPIEVNWGERDELRVSDIFDEPDHSMLCVPIDDRSPVPAPGTCDTDIFNGKHLSRILSHSRPANLPAHPAPRF
jgi:hypothetical protein